MSAISIETKEITNQKEIDEAVNLVTEVFMQYEAPDYSQEGVDNFFKTALYDADFMKSLTIYGAYEGQTLVGVVATRSEGRHIALFFVDGAHHRRGIGRMLFEEVKKNAPTKEITVNSSPFAKDFYHRLGFIDMSEEQTVTGIRFIPMQYIIA